MREPPFWWRAAGIQSTLLAPLSAAYGAIAARRLAREGRRAAVPVVCVGNPTVGGAGKTPAALAIADILKRRGERPVFLSRGYGGALGGPVQVDPTRHRASDVGDEPLLLARAASAVVARDRVAGAQTAAALGATVVVMDDGFQNPSLKKDFSVLVVDGGRGLGNGRVIPAGPLRAPLEPQLARAQALIVVGSLRDPKIAEVAQARGVPVFHARLVPEPGFVSALGGGRALAFAGIGDPDKFFATLREAGIAVEATRSFADHHSYTTAEAKALCEEADGDGLILVTTEKDLARIQGDEWVAVLAAHAHALPVTLALEDEAAFTALLMKQIAAARS